MKLVDCFTNFSVFIYKFVNQFNSVTFLGIRELCLNSFLVAFFFNMKAQSKYKTKPVNTRY